MDGTQVCYFISYLNFELKKTPGITDFNGFLFPLLYKLTSPDPVAVRFFELLTITTKMLICLIFVFAFERCADIEDKTISC